MCFQSLTRANYYDCDSENRLKISAATRYMQQASSEHLESLGMPPKMLYAQNMAFLLSKMCVKIHRMPLAGETVKIGTVPTETRGARFVREFAIDSENGERLISALSLWLLVDPETRKILRPQNFPYPLPFGESIIHGAMSDMPIKKPPDDSEKEYSNIDIRYSHIDTNAHVNNSVYFDFVCDALPHDKILKNGLDMLVISFQNEARWGDRLELATSALSGREYYVSGRRGDTPCFEAMAII